MQHYHEASDAKQKKYFFFKSKKHLFNCLHHNYCPTPQKNHIFYNLKKGKDISILWRSNSVIHIIYCIIQAVKHYMNCS